MSEFYEYRVWSPPGRLVKLLRTAGFVGGSVLVAVASLALATQPLSRTGELNAKVLICCGAFLIGIVWWQRRAWRSEQFSLGTTVMRIDEQGVWFRTDADVLSEDEPATASVVWSAIESVAIGPLVLPPEDGEGEPAVSDVFRFVLADESAVKHDPYPPYLVAQASALGISPAAASMGFVISRRQTTSMVREIIEWLHKHQPGLPVRDTRR